MPTYKKRPTTFTELQLTPSADVATFLDGKPLTVATYLAPESGTGLIVLTNDDFTAAGLSTAFTVGTYLRLQDVPGGILQPCVVDESLANDSSFEIIS